MSEVKVNKITPTADCGTVTLGDSGDAITIPSGVTLTSGGAITNSGTITNTGTISGGTISGNIDGQVNWQTTVKTTGFTATAGEGYFCNTTSAAFTVTLPASPSAGDIVGIKDYANTADTNNITIGRNGSNIQGTANDFLINTEGLAIILLYVDSTKGWLSVGQSKASDIAEQATFIQATGGTVVTCGDFKTHIFTGPGTFCVSAVGNPLGSTTVDYFVVAGGGSGATAGYGGGGGGAGGLRTNYPSCCSGTPVTAQGYPITVGGGAAISGNRGANSIFSTITSTGGGGGSGSGSSAPSCSPGGSGGGGGGSNSGNPGNTSTAGTGNTPPVSPPQGNPGGTGRQGGSGTPYKGGGGGGAGGAGSAGPKAGGVGSPLATAFIGPTAPSYGTSGPNPGRYFAGGGGGNEVGDSGVPTSLPQGSGGSGGGGAASGPGYPRPPGTPGTANTGGGGGGGGVYPGPQVPAGAGGSGIVMIRYKYQ